MPSGTPSGILSATVLSDRNASVSSSFPSRHSLSGFPVSPMKSFSFPVGAFAQSLGRKRRIRRRQASSGLSPFYFSGEEVWRVELPATCDGSHDLSVRSGYAMARRLFDVPFRRSLEWNELRSQAATGHVVSPIAGAAAHRPQLSVFSILPLQLHPPIISPSGPRRRWRVLTRRPKAPPRARRPCDL